MNKFTIFTVVLAIVVVAVASQIVSDKYLPTLKTSVLQTDGEINRLGADIQYADPSEEDALIDETDLDNDEITGVASQTEENSDLDLSDQLPFEGELAEIESGSFEIDNQAPIQRNPVSDSAARQPVGTSTNSQAGGSTKDFEDPNFSFTSGSSYAPNVYLSEEQVQSAGFKNATLETEADDGFLFKTIYVGDLFDVAMDKVAVKAESSLLARVYIFKVGSNSQPDEVMNVIKLRADELSGVEVNENDEFGNRSFYINDSARSSAAFLIVRFNTILYGFSYPKDYHSQIKNLIKLLSWEFGA